MDENALDKTDGPAVRALYDIFRYMSSPIDEHDDGELSEEWAALERRAVGLTVDSWYSETSRLWGLCSWAWRTLPVSLLRRDSTWQ